MKRIKHKRVLHKARPKKTHEHAQHKEKKSKPAAKHKGPVRGKGKMEVEFITHVPDGEKKRIRHMVDDYSEILTLETNIDRLYSELVKRGEAKVKDVAKEFSVDASLVEDWGRILEDHGLAELHYPALGEIVIRIKKMPKPAKTEDEDEDG